MADTRPDIILPANTPVDLYAALNAQAGFPSVTVGDKLRVINKGSLDVYVYSGATAPTLDPSSRPGVPLPKYASGTNDSGDAGAWCTSVVSDGVISVAVVA